MSVALIGGMNRLEQKYMKEAEKLGLELRVFSESKKHMDVKLKHAQAVVIFTNKVSHQARNDAMNAAKTHGIPVFMHHACGVCTLRECLKCILIINQKHERGSP